MGGKTYSYIKKNVVPIAAVVRSIENYALDDPNLDINERCDSQAQRAREIKAIYDWWTITRPARPDPHDLSGWTEICDEGRNGGIKIFQRGNAEFESGFTTSRS